MRSLALIALGISTLAFAKTDGGCDKPKEVMQCSDPEAKVEMTVDFETYETRTIAIIRKGEKLMAEVPCFRKATENSSSDKPEVMMECYNPNVVDAGFRTTLTKADFTGRQWTSITETTIAGASEIAKLPCLKK